MKNTSIVAGSILAATLIVGSASAAYLYYDTLQSSKAEIQPIAASQATSSLSEVQSKLPAGFVIKEIFAVTGTSFLVSAAQPVTESNYGTYDLNLGLWKYNDATSVLEKVHEYKSTIPAGLNTRLLNSPYDHEFIYIIEEAWEGWRHVQNLRFDQDGNLVAMIQQPSDLEFTITTKTDALTVKTDGKTCHGDTSRATTSTSIITSLNIDGQSVSLSKPYTLNCEFSDMQAVQMGTIFTDLQLSEPHYDRSRRVYAHLYRSDIELVFSVDEKGSIKLDR